MPTCFWPQEAHLRRTRDRSHVNWDEFVRCQVRANETYSETKRQLSDRNRDVLMNVQSHIFGALSCRFWSIAQHCGAQLPTHLKLLDRVVRSAAFLAGGVLERNLAHRRTVA